MALSLGLPPPDLVRHRVSMEPGLSSPASWSGRPADWRTVAVDALRGKVKARSCEEEKRWGGVLLHRKLHLVNVSSTLAESHQNEIIGPIYCRGIPHHELACRTDPVLQLVVVD